MKKITEMNIQEIEKMINDFEKDSGRKVAHINITNFQLNKIIKNTEHPDIYHYPTSGRVRVNNTDFNIGNYEEDEDSLNAVFSN